MKKLRLLIGFPIGIAMLAVSYILVYLVDGQETYVMELAKLTDVKYFTAQVIFSGIAYLAVIGYAKVYDSFSKRKEKGITWGDLAKLIISTFVLAGVIPAIAAILDTKETMSGEVGTMLVGTAIIALIVAAIVAVFKNCSENRKINQALKEKKEK